jgi:YesN/AraC family two-component response regulator
MIKKILIVDDNEDLRSDLADFLNDYEVVQASSGESAIKIIQKANEIALVILDVVMQGMNGLEALQRIKATDPNLAVVILTGFSSKDVAIKALKAQADDYIEKPIDLEKVRSIVDRLMEKQHGIREVDELDMKGKVEKVKYFIQRNCLKKTGLEEAAEAVSLSSKYLSRIFKQTAGMGFAEYRTQVKVEKAKELLTGSGYNVNQIAERLGYKNPESFIRQFKKSAKATPASFRHKLQKHKNGKGATRLA